MNRCKFYKQQRQVSYNNGTTWESVSPAEYRKGNLYESGSTDCGHLPPSINGKILAEYLDNKIFSAACDSSSDLTRDETNPSEYERYVMSEVVIGSCVNSISELTFCDCISLSSVTMPDSITSIGDGAFEDCWGLPSITIPSGVTSIGHWCFTRCYSLSSVTIPNSVTSIGQMAFAGCTSLTDIVISNNITQIDWSTFAGCTNLKSVTIPNGVTTINMQAFEGCTSLSSVTIPNSVTIIGATAFYNCSSFTGITVESATPPTLGSDAFNNTNNCPIYVPAESVNAYKQASGWSSYSSRITAIQ